MSAKKTVCIVGGGPCGTAAIKSFKEEGFEPTCFERTHDVGGLWRYHEDDVDGIASVMKSTIINTSKESSAISDFPPPAEFPNYMHNTLMYKGIRMYAEHFDCLRHIRFNHETKKIEKSEDYEKTGRWKVTNLNLKTGEQVTETFDCVVVCIGHHVYPNVPTFPNQEEFEGKVMHTHSLKKVDGYEDKTVVVVGVGNSGMDAAVELSSVTKQVYLCSRRGTWVLPRVGPGGEPLDSALLRRVSMLGLHYLPYGLVCSVVEWWLNQRFNHSLYRLQPQHRVFSQHPTVSDTLPVKLLSGVVAIRGNIKQFTKKGVVFEGEKKETEADAVILATGYKVKFPFLSEDIVPVTDNHVQLYKYMVPPDLPHCTLAILGLIQPSGPGFPVGEMQSRWISRLMAGKLQLPPKEDMLKDIKKNDEFNRKRFVSSPRHTVQVDFVGYMDELAADIGAKPNLFKLAITDPQLFFAIFFGPCLSYQYRLQGPHPWKGAREAILTAKQRMIKPLEKPGESKYAPKTLLDNQFSRILFFVLIIAFFYVILFR